MDKYEYKVHSEEISKLIDEEKYAEAANVADIIDWRRVKSITMLLKIAALYRVNRRNEDSRAILVLAYDRYPTNRSVVYSLCEVSIELDDVVAAIEYYKQFAKLAPRDNGVYTLRYKILEAQEASLEERIGILEELKRRDYQEEWAYELAYLYHKVGLSTKCVEECDDVILWFGDGPYVMKAMELKMLHTPLTEIQQKKYDIMQGVSQENNQEQNYNEEAYEDNYNEQNYNEEAYEDNYNEQNYNEEAYEEYYNGQDYNEEAYEDNYNEQNYNEEYYNGQDYNEPAYKDNYNEQNYSDTNYNEQGYAETAYDMNYNEQYMQTGTYNQEEYIPDGYDSYNDEFFAEQTDEEDYQSEYLQTDNTYNNGYDTYNNQVYDENSYTEPVNKNTNSSAVDMSQYNTINLQKVVAESMKELFPDDDFSENSQSQSMEISDNYENNDYTQIYKAVSDIEEPVENEKIEVGDETRIIFKSLEAEAIQMSKMNQQESLQEQAENEEEQISYSSIDNEQETLQEPVEDKEEYVSYSSIDNEQEQLQEAAKDYEYQEQSSIRHTGKIAQMVAGVSEEAPQPHTGAIKKVIVPGNDARVIKEDSDIKELRDITEKTVEEEHNRMEANAENVYQPQNILNSVEEENLSNTNSQMNLKNVLDEWEHIKQVNVQKHQEAVRHNILTHTGRLFADFDNSINTGVLGELNQDISDVNKTQAVEDNFLQADSQDIDEADRCVQNSEAVEYEQYNQSQQYESQYNNEYYGDEYYDDQEYINGEYSDNEYYDESQLYEEKHISYNEMKQNMETDNEIDSEEAEMIAEMAKEDAMKTQEIKMNTADLSSLSDKILAATRKETKGVKQEELREFSDDEQKLFENFAVTKKIKKQILYAMEQMTLSAYTGNIIITGETGLDTIKMAKNLIREFQNKNENFSGKVAKITGAKLNNKNLREVLAKLNNGALIIEKANGLTAEKLYEMAVLLNQENIGIIVVVEDTKKEINKMFAKQAMLADYFDIRIDLIEMDINALVAYAKNYANALEYSIDDLGVLALYTRISNMQSGNHVVTKDEVRDIIDEAIWKSKKFKIKNFVDVLFARRYDSEDMIVLKERDFI